MTATLIDGPRIAVETKPSRWARMKAKVKSFFTAIGTKVKSAWNRIRSGGLWASIKARTKSAWNWLKAGPVGQVAKSGWQWAGRTFGRFFSGAGRVLATVWTWFIGLGVITWVIGAVAFFYAFLWAAFRKWVIGFFAWVFRTDRTKSFKQIRAERNVVIPEERRRIRKTKVVKAEVKDEGTIVVPTPVNDHGLKDIEELIENEDAESAQREFLADTSLQLMAMAQATNAEDAADLEKAFPGVEVDHNLLPQIAADPEFLLDRPILMRPKSNKVLDALDEWAGETGQVPVSYDFTEHKDHKALMEVLQRQLEISGSWQQASFWTGRIEALRYFSENKGQLNEHGRWWALINLHYRNEGGYHMTHLRAGFKRMVSELEAQRQPVGARNRRAS